MLVCNGIEDNCEEKGLANKWQPYTSYCAEREKVQNATQLAGYLRYDGAGHWPVPTESRQKCTLCIKAYARVKYEKTFSLRVEIVL